MVLVKVIEVNGSDGGYNLRPTTQTHLTFIFVMVLKANDKKTYISKGKKLNV